MQISPKSIDRRLERGETSRKLILASAVSTIAAHGLGSMTLDRVAEQAGISRALVIFHFKSKHNLILEVLEYLSRRYSTGWLEIVGAEAESSMSKLLQLAEYDISFAYQNPKYVSAWHSFWGESRGKEMFRNLAVPRDEGYAADMENLLYQINEVEGYHFENIPVINRGLNSMMFGTWVLQHLNPDKGDFDMSMDAIRLYLNQSFPKTRLPD
ncbi:MAG: TetR/AcrR family transcriptional regulator [Gammaproteobacteria bacterium]|nr:TetR/AcrR family transcriptional regulator [Gammaproteobacteria bacterium]